MGFWTDERIARLKELWLDGWSGTQIQREMGACSRNAVIGKLHRLGLKRDLGFVYDRPKAERKQRAPRGTYKKRSVKWTPDKGIERIKIALTEVLDMNQESIAARARADAEIPQAQRKTLLQLRPDDCHWPVGDPQTRDFFFCGDEAAPGHSYCLPHCRRAYQPNSARAPRVPRALNAAMGRSPMMDVRIVDQGFEAA